MTFNELSKWHHFYAQVASYICLKQRPNPMRPFLTRIFFFILATGFVSHGYAQYTITKTSEGWATTGAPSFCNNCTFTIPAGDTLRLNVSGVTCVNCLFTGGTVLDSTNFEWQGGTFSGDSVAFDYSGANLQVSGVGGPVFNNGKVTFTEPATCQGCTFTGDAVHINLPSATAQVTFQSSGSFTTTTVTSSTITVNTGQWYANSATNVASSTMTFNNSSSIDNNTGTFTLSGSSINLNGNSYISTSTGFVLENTGWITVGDGSLASGAYFFDNSGTNLAIDDNSGIGIANQNNYYSNWGQYTYTPSSGSSKNYTTTGLDYNCGSGYAHTTAYCNSNSEYVFGCATLNSKGPLACVTLAVSGVNLTAEPGTNGIDLSWTDPQNNTAASYLVQRSAGNDAWTTISLITADDLSSGDYHYLDQTAPAGTFNYRIARTAQDGNISFSAVASVSISHAPNNVSIFPNPVSGHTFYVTMPNTGQFTLNVYTLTGQLLMRSTLQGQTQYPVQVPVQLQPGNTIIVQTILADRIASFPLLLR